MKRNHKLLFAFVMLGIILTIVSGCTAAAPSPTIVPTDIPAPTATATPIPRSATIKSITGTVEVRSGPDAEYAPAEVGQVLAVGNELRTGEDGRAVIALDDGTAIAVASGSQISLSALEGTHESPVTNFFLALGKLFSVGGGELAPGASFEIDTPKGTAAIRGSMLGVAYSEAEGASVNCLVGHCSAALNDQEVALTGGKAVAITDAGPGEVTDMEPEDLREWSVALNQIEVAGTDISGGIDPTCSCTGTDLTCADGTVIPAFPTCIEGQSCECDGTSLVCPDQTYENDPVCAAGSLACTCQGPNLFCDDGSSFFNSLACTGGSLCFCQGADLTCADGTTYPNDIACVTVSSSGCQCFEGYEVCADGTVNFNTPSCSNPDIPCSCQGTTFVCSDPGGGGDISIPDYPLCGGTGGVFPGSGGDTSCVCAGPDLYCSDGSVVPGSPSCAGAPAVPEFPVP
jgi:hypothetical protein